jgi:hypothetical protein
VIDQKAADLYFRANPAGAVLIDSTGRRVKIIGVVRSFPLVTFQRSVEPATYFPTAQYVTRTTLILRVPELKGSQPKELRRRIEAIPGGGPSPVVVETLDAHLGETALAPLRIATAILGACAAIALILGVPGLFGAMSDAVRQRRRETAVRVALGAKRWQVTRHVLEEGGRLAFAGALMGTSGSLLLSRWLAGITTGVGSPALWVWVAGPLLLAGAVVLAGVLPARRALLVSPITIMHDGH